MGNVVYATRRDRNHPQIYRTQVLDYESDPFVDLDALIEWVKGRPDSYRLEVDEKAGFVTAEYIACGANAHDLREGWPIQDQYRLKGQKTRICGCGGSEDQCVLSKETRRLVISQQIEKWMAES